MEKGIPPRWHMLDDPDAVAKQAVQRILQSASRAIAERNLFRIVLTGGHTPEATYGLLVDADTDWSRWEIYFGDERCLPSDHAERNSIISNSRSWYYRTYFLAFVKKEQYHQKILLEIT